MVITLSSIFIWNLFDIVSSTVRILSNTHFMPIRESFSRQSLHYLYPLVFPGRNSPHISTFTTFCLTLWLFRHFMILPYPALISSFNSHIQLNSTTFTTNIVRYGTHQAILRLEWDLCCRVTTPLTSSLSSLWMSANHFSPRQKKIPLPDRYRTLLAWQRSEAKWARFLCLDCKKFKAPAQYSNKQLNDYRFKIHTRQHVTNISAQLRCRHCTGEQTHELQCTGPCALWKCLEDFSKNQRKRPENAVGCSNWDLWGWIKS